MVIRLRKFEHKDIQNKVRWVNDPEINQYLHYDLPLRVDKTELWFSRIEHDKSRIDFSVDVDDVSVGYVGLLNIDYKNRKAEAYVMLGDKKWMGKGIASKAMRLLTDYAFLTLDLNKLYLMTEVDNIAAQRLFEKVGYKKEGVMIQDLHSKNGYVDRIYYGLLKEQE